MLGDSHLTTSVVCSNSLTNRRVVSECVERGTKKASSNVPDHGIEHERAMMKTLSSGAFQPHPPRRAECKFEAAIGIYNGT